MTFTLEANASGGATLTVDGARLALDQAELRELRDGIDAAVALGARGGQGPAHRFTVGGATVTVSAAPGGAVRLHIDH